MKNKLFFRTIEYIIGYKVTNVINLLYYATLINNMATDSPHSIAKCNMIDICLQK